MDTFDFDKKEKVMEEKKDKEVNALTLPIMRCLEPNREDHIC